MSLPLPLIDRHTRAFMDPDEIALAEQFLAHGHVIQPVTDRAPLDRIRAAAAGLAAGHLGVAGPTTDPEIAAFLNGIHTRIDAADLNALRLAVFNGLNATEWLRPAYVRLARSALTALVGNELAMQRRINLSIQLPADASSLLPVHADTWSGDSPYEVVVWLPLVDCAATKSMYLLAPGAYADAMVGFGAPGDSAEAFFGRIEPHVRWLTVPYGSVLLFTQNLPHGNVVNRETETRWSMNCRFKGVFTPYADKKVGEFFEPITLRAASRLGLEYRYPGEDA